jgi:hypothetical protein
MIHERIYEITMELPNEDWIYFRLISTFHEACGRYLYMGPSFARAVNAVIQHLGGN